MKKIVFFFFLFFLAIANALEGRYVGFGMGSGSGTEYWDYGKTSSFYGASYSARYDYNFDASIKDFKLGFDYDDFRLEVSSTSINAEFAGVTKSFSGVDFNYLVPLTKDKSELFPFVSVGLGRYSGSALRGFSFNLDFGACFSVTDEVEMELAYKVKVIQWEEIKQAGVDNLDISEQITYIYFGVKYKF